MRIFSNQSEWGESFYRIRPFTLPINILNPPDCLHVADGSKVLLGCGQVCMAEDHLAYNLKRDTYPLSISTRFETFLLDVMPFFDRVFVPWLNYATHVSGPSIL